MFFQGPISNKNGPGQERTTAAAQGWPNGRISHQSFLHPSEIVFAESGRFLTAILHESGTYPGA